MYQEIKGVFTNSLIYGFGNLLNRFVGFLMIPIYTRLLTPQDYGIIAMLTLFSSFVVTFFNASINGSFMRFYFERYKKENVYGTSLMILLGISIISIIILLPISGAISMLLFRSSEYSFFIKLITLTLAFQLIETLPMSLFRARQEPVKYIIFSTLQLALGLSLNIYLIAILRLGILGFLYSGLISSIVMVILLIAVTAVKTKLSFSYRLLKKIIQFGAPLVFSSIIYFAYYNSDLVFLERYTSLSQVGLYQLASQFSSILITLVLVPFSLNWNATQYSIYEKGEAKKVFPRILTYFTSALVFIGLCTSLLINDMLKIVASKDFIAAASIVPILVLGVIIWSMKSPFYSAIDIKKKTKYYILLDILAFIIIIPLNYLLISKYGAYGAACSKLIAFTIIFLVAYLISYNLLRIKYEFKRIAVLFAVASSLYLISTYVPQEAIISLTIRCIILACFPIILFLIGFFKKDELDKAKEITRKLINELLKLKHKPSIKQRK
jgi:O-antigen/teichoic acid export membrane protein